MQDLSAEAVAKIRSELAGFRERPFGWDGGNGLPLREDVLRWITWFLDDDYYVHLYRKLIKLPACRMEVDGTVSVGFHQTFRHTRPRPFEPWADWNCPLPKRMMLWFPCAGTIGVTQAPDDQSRIESFVRRGTGEVATFRRDVDEVFRWLLDGEL